MTHEEYVSVLETAGDSPAEVESVLAHAAACAVCRAEHRRADRALASLELRPSSLERLARWAAAALLLVAFFAGLHIPSTKNPPVSSARYRVVGDATGVVAYTPEGLIVSGGAMCPSDKEVSR